MLGLIKRLREKKEAAPIISSAGIRRKENESG
jgi:hypothetical protein